MFATDARARALTQKAIAKGWTTGETKAQLASMHELFPTLLLLPLEHSESLSDHDVLAGELEGGDFPDSVKTFAKDHRDVVERFGRYPHRNAMVGRESTPEEVEFLKDHKGW